MDQERIEKGGECWLKAAECVASELDSVHTCTLALLR